MGIITCTLVNIRYAMRGTHVYDLQKVTQSEKHEADKDSSRRSLVALSYGIEGSDLWSIYMSNLYHVKTDLFDCYFDDNYGPLFVDM